MKKLRRTVVSITILCLLLSVKGVAKSLPIVENGHSDWTIVCGSAERDKLAATDFQEIFEKGTGISLELRVKSEECRTGRCFLVGAEFADRQLADEQTLVTERGGNIVLAGGGVAGTCYAVYDFCEKYFGYRLYGTYPGAEIVKKVTDLAWDGKDISTRPAFRGYRISHNIPRARNEAEARFFRRNRNNAGDKPVTDRILGAQHGLFLWVPSTEKGYGSTWLDKLIGVKWEPMFEKHPEYFSLDRKGKRTNRGQLCFANKDVRTLLISRFREFAAKKGPGIYMVGSNDSHNERYCWCDGCAKMVEKYRTNGGPLWDFILELCGAVKDMKDVYIASLVYKGPEQTELAPTGVVFPENFVADLGFLNADRPPSRMRDIKLDDGRVYNRIQSIRDWKAIAQHVAWWYYGGGMPIQTYRRMQVEMRELLAAGVDSIGACGTGGSFEFQDVGDYMFFQLMRDPEMDADAAVMDIFRHKYGAAAQLVFDYLKELETYALDNWGKPDFSFGTEDKYEKIPLEGADIERWQGYFEKALELVRDDPQSLANVKIARTGLDCWTIVWASRVRKDAPGFKLDTNAILTRAFAACDAAEKRGIVTAKGDFARRSLESMKYYAMLKTDALPAELAKEDPAKVWLYLPEEPKHDYAAKSHALVKDPKAAAGVAIPVRNQNFAKSVNVQLFDAAGKEWLKVHPIDAKDVSGTEYRMVEFGVSRIPRTGMLVFGNAWGFAADIRTLDRFYDPSYHEKLFQFYASVRREGNDLLIDRIYLVDRGMPESNRPRPSEIQMKYLETEMMGIVHYGLNTYVDREWGFGDTPPSVFKPTALDPEQWVVAAKAGGLKRLVLVCKHHDGFCLFPSKLNSDYTIANTSWKDGKGDLVKEFREACRKHGLEFGAYLSPWDRHQANYASAAYTDYFHGQWDELMANYGPICEIWLDGANGGDGWYGGAKETRKLPSAAREYYRFGELLDKLARKFPQAIAFGGGLRPNCSIWCGNETGMNPETCWNVRDGVYIPNEADTPFRCGGWFWHPDDRPKSLAELVDVYFMTVGRNSVLDLGLAPNRDGVIGADDVARLKEFGDYVRAFNATDFAADAKRTETREGNRLTVNLKLPAARSFNTIDLKEEISDGQTIGTWTAEAKVGGEWKALAKGTTVGSRRMERFASVETDEVRIVLEGEKGRPVIRSAALRFAPPVKPEPVAQDFEQWRSPVKLTEPAPDVRIYDLLRHVAVDTFQYRPPKDRTDGVPDKFALYASDDGATWREVMTGEFGNLRANPVMQRLPMPGKVEARYFKVVALRALDGSPRWEGTLTEFFCKKKETKKVK